MIVWRRIVAFFFVSAVSSRAQLFDDLMSQFPHSQRAISEGIAEALKEESMSSADVSCLRDYTSCPIGYADLGQDRCEAVSAYSKDCGILDFSSQSPFQKKQMAAECNVAFPCQ
eukprot:TRINITY_DN38273_c0_g1_i1.p1 TRINITY_DN38273_c0_g1~~TRINITY_DN38273_c0_g1_i1.p1  ORF type:complete len:114 (-),score=12.67 TRINITY_DN38273_c0_g1_i1:100-441(-)